MSESDSFIEEVTEEVRRDRLFQLFRRYGWIGAVVVVAIVGGAAWNEWQKAQTEARAQALGDAILGALEANEPADRVAALRTVTPETSGGAAMLSLLIAAEEAEAGNGAQAADRLQTVATDTEVPEIYRQIAAFKALLAQGTETPAAERRQGFGALAIPGNTLRLLAEEQIALIDLEEGDTQAAIDRLVRIASDAEATPGLRQRATQLIVALGGEPPRIAAEAG
ncbi:tetratricopeptide repeat protein [Pseudaestuariivita atlantica]|uniref:Ancillary SecYEG translocon subunit/Cell division coordinator CpoB TPR domain-containing protein n=1 Tax=Pseudaestuariivita atlantica TaxID=1317121 RepID=A0A0L1JVE1_9RHOB|nr:tetratricopeptide repeat protein [Pseudaestuariivita atlantica]KNG95363.1 hypothetical protein ATO11_01700 [Pseudaestuariivita atlantica]